MQVVLVALMVALATCYVFVASLSLVLRFRGSRLRQIGVAVAAVTSVGFLWVSTYHILVTRPRQEQAIRQAMAVGVTEAYNEETKYAVVEVVVQAQLDLRVSCAMKSVLQRAEDLETDRSDAGTQLRVHAETIDNNARDAAERLFSSELLAQMGTTPDEHCAFAKRLEGLSAMNGRVVGDRVWHFPLTSGESLELAVNAKHELQFTRFISQL